MPLPTFTDEQYATLLAAYVSGTKEVEYADKKVVYRSLEDMERLLGVMAEQLSPSTAPSRIRHTSYTSGHFPC